MKAFRTLDQADVKGKRVLVRVDLNVPMENGRITDATRIERILPTLREIVRQGREGRSFWPISAGPKGRDRRRACGRSRKRLAQHLGTSPWRSPKIASATPRRKPWPR